MSLDEAPIQRASESHASSEKHRSPQSPLQCLTRVLFRRSRGCRHSAAPNSSCTRRRLDGFPAILLMSEKVSRMRGLRYNKLTPLLMVFTSPPLTASAMKTHRAAAWTFGADPLFATQRGCCWRQVRIPMPTSWSRTAVERPWKNNGVLGPFFVTDA